MSKRILYTNAEGNLVVVTPILESGLTIEEIVAKDIPAGLGYEVVDVASIPSDRTFRNAWSHCPVNKVKVDLVKAKDVIRAKRNHKLEELDKIAVAESRKPNGNIGAVNAEAQRLRDITGDARFSSGTVEDLKSLYDEV